jgi:ribose transport system ATP-binding protein
MTRLSPGREAALARPWIERLGVACRGPAQAVGELSGGNQQKVAIGRLLHHGVDVLLLDEPTRGVDVASKAEIYRLVDGLVAREGKAALWVSSYIPELLGVCDRIAVMARGALGPARPAAEWSEEALLREATAA